MQIVTPLEQLFFVTVRITASDGSESWSGTAFHYGVETDIGLIPFLITNKHVLENATEITIHNIAATASGGAPELGKAVDVTVRPSNPPSWVSHPNANVDVIAWPTGGIFNKLNSEGRTPFRAMILSYQALTDSVANELDAIEEVTFVGYPNGLFDQKNLLPIARRGRTATPVCVDYCGDPTFLIDASVFPGSSGSPVLLSDSGTYTNRSGAVVVGRRMILLGVLGAVHIRRVAGQIGQIRPTGLGFQFTEPIDLGIVYKAQAIDEAVDIALKRYKAVRVPHAAPIVQPRGTAQGT